MKAAKNSQAAAKSEAAAPAPQPILAQSQSQQQQPAGLTQEDLQILRAEFEPARLGVKVQSLNKDRTRAMLVLYLQHTDVQDRLEQVDPSWTSEVMGEERLGDTVYVRLRLKLKGVARENVGEGGDPKAAFSDALKRAAMLFGVGRYLYDSPTVWTDYDESRDRFKQWSVEDYDAALQRSGARPAPAAAPSRAAPAPRGLRTKPPAAEAAAPENGGLEAEGSAASTDAPRIKPAGAKGKTRPREELNRVLMNLYRPYLTHFPQTQFSQLLQTRYQVGETRLMTVEQLEDLVSFMETKLQSVA